MFIYWKGVFALTVESIPKETKDEVAAVNNRRIKKKSRKQKIIVQESETASSQFTYITAYHYNAQDEDQILSKIELKADNSKRRCDCELTCRLIVNGHFTCMNRTDTNSQKPTFCTDATCGVYNETGRRTCGNYYVERNPNLKIVQTGEKGNGMFASEPFLAGEFLSMYFGELKLRTTFEEEDDYLYEIGEETIYVSDLVSNKRIAILHNDEVEDENQDGSVDEFLEEYIGVIVDARHYGNDSRFINHSCYPNAQLFKWHYQDKVALAIIATEDIEAGHEVTFSYTDSNEPPDFMNKCLCDHCEENHPAKPFPNSVRYDTGAPNTFANYKGLTGIFVSFLTIFSTNNIAVTANVLRGELKREQLNEVYEKLKSDYDQYRMVGTKSDTLNRSILHSISYLINFLAVKYDDIGYGSIITSTTYVKMYQLYVMSFYAVRYYFHKELHARSGREMCSVTDFFEVFQHLLKELRRDNSSMTFFESMTTCSQHLNLVCNSSKVLIVKLAHDEGTRVQCYARETLKAKLKTYKLVGISTNEHMRGTVVNTFTLGLRNGSWYRTKHDSSARRSSKSVLAQDTFHEERVDQSIRLSPLDIILQEKECNCHAELLVYMQFR